MPNALSNGTRAEMRKADELFTACKKIEASQAAQEKDLATAHTEAIAARAVEIEALASGDETRARAARAQATEMEARVAAGPEVAAVLKARWDVAAAAWSSQWHVARQAIEAELLDPLLERRRRFEEQELAVRDECARLVGELRS